MVVVVVGYVNLLRITTNKQQSVLMSAIITTDLPGKAQHPNQTLAELRGSSFSVMTK